MDANNGLRRQNVPPRREGDLWIERLKGSAKKQFTIYSRSIWGVWTHWSGKRTHPCFAARDTCPGCTCKWPERWKGYLHAYDHLSRRPVFVELTPTAARALLAQVGPGVSLRGLRISMQRTSSDRGRLHIHLEGAVQVVERLADELDPYEAITKLMGFPQEQGTVKLTFPDTPEEVETARLAM